MIIPWFNKTCNPKIRTCRSKPPSKTKCRPFRNLRALNELQAQGGWVSCNYSFLADFRCLTRKLSCNLIIIYVLVNSKLLSLLFPNCHDITMCFHNVSQATFLTSHPECHRTVACFKRSLSYADLYSTTM